jgi:PAS domain S-box-containing protein
VLQQSEDDVPRAQMESLEKLEALLASAPLGIAFLDPDLRVERVNAALAAVLGAPASECEGRTVQELVPQLADALLPMLRRVAKTGEAMPDLDFSGQAPGTQGRTRHWLAAFFPLRSDTAELTGVGIILRDITARKEAADRDRRLARHREELHALAAALVEAMTPAEVVSAVVAHAAKAFGAVGSVIARRTADGQHVELLGADGMPADIAEEWRRFPLSAPVPLAQVTRTGVPLFLESSEDWARHFTELLPVAESVGHHANIVVPLSVESRVVGALGIAFDAPRTFDDEERAVAESVARQCALALERARLLEAERLARAEADAASQVKTQFLATMSHELRTPLNAIGGYAELLEMGIHGPVTEPQRDILSRIQRSQRHLLGLINNVLNLVKLDTGHENFQITDVALDPVLQFVAETTAPQREAKHLRLGQIPCPGVKVRGDEEKLRQVLLNLLSNAIKFTEDGGTISIECIPQGQWMRIDVRDTGTGIPPDQLDRIFDPFVQVDRRLNRPIEGTGLGLAISRQLARGMGGDLSVESTLGAGSVFSLRVPLV